MISLFRDGTATQNWGGVVWWSEGIPSKGLSWLESTPPVHWRREQVREDLLSLIVFRKRDSVWFLSGIFG